MNSVKHKLMNGENVLGTFNFFDDPAAIEIIGLAGFDFVIVDMEHSPRGFDQVENMVRAAELIGMTPLVRVPSVTESDISRALETGAQGIVLRMLESPEEVAHARSAMLYPPAGRRGTCSASRAARYTALRPRFAEYLRQANNDVLLVGLIESVAGVERADEIIAAGLDAVVVGRGDLSAALGVAAQSQHAEVLAMCASVAGAAQRSGSAAYGSTAGSQEEMGALLEQGCRMFIYRDDTTVLLEMFTKAAEGFRGGLGSRRAAPVTAE